MVEASTLEAPVLAGLDRVRPLVYVSPALPNFVPLRRRLEGQLAAKLDAAGLCLGVGEAWLSLKVLAYPVPGQKERPLFQSVSLELIEPVRPLRKANMGSPIDSATWSSRRMGVVQMRRADGTAVEWASELLSAFLLERDRANESARSESESDPQATP